MPLALKFLVRTAALVGPGIAHANAGIPMLALAWPAQWLALIPIVLLECEVARRSMQLPFRRLLWPVAKANLISTLVGIPIAWLVMLLPTIGVGIGLSLIPTAVEIPTYIHYALFPLTAAWVGGDSVWQVYFAFIALTVPFCIVSIFLEEGVLRKAFPNYGHPAIHTFTVRANVFSYILLSGLALIFPLTA